jgi:hypothetical protein
MKPHFVELFLHGKKYEILITINALTEIYNNGEKEHHYDMELRTEGRLSGDEFQAIKAYLEAEGHIDAACEKFRKSHRQ